MSRTLNSLNALVVSYILRSHTLTSRTFEAQNKNKPSRQQHNVTSPSTKHQHQHQLQKTNMKLITLLATLAILTTGAAAAAIAQNEIIPVASVDPADILRPFAQVESMLPLHMYACYDPSWGGRCQNMEANSGKCCM